MRHSTSMLLVDLILIMLATIFALILRDNLQIFPEKILSQLPYLGVTLAVAAPILALFGLNRSIWRFSAMPDYGRVVSAAGLTILSVVALGFLLNRLDEIPRSLPVLQALLMVLLLIIVRVMIRQRSLLREKSRAVLRQPSAVHRPPAETVLVAGVNRIAELYLQSVAEFASGRFRIAGLLARSERHTGRLVQQQTVLGTPEEALNVIKMLAVHGVFVDRIVVTTAFTRLSSEAQQALQEIESTSNIRVDLIAEWMCLETRKDKMREVTDDGARHQLDPAMFSFDETELEALARQRYWWTKRAIDIAASAFLIVLLSPLFLVVASLAAIDFGLDVTFWQQRPGIGGRPFKLRKFRTMAAAYDCQGQRVPDDDRLLLIGRFLRRTRLDELPQLYNILIGDMTFVGPRPLLPADQPSAYSARLLVRPGLTGWAQVKGGRGIPAADKAALDVWYVRNASLALDLKILALTIPMVIFGERVSGHAIRWAWRELTAAGICAFDPTLGPSPLPQLAAKADAGRVA